MADMLTDTVDRLTFRGGMSLLAAAVNVITTDGPAGRAGFTASAVCSVSDEPPTLLVCMNRASQSHRIFVQNRVLCVNVLAAGQVALSALFSNREVAMVERFERTPWSLLRSGAPALDGALVNFDAEVQSVHEVGTHSIFYAQVCGMRVSDPAHGGLVYFNRAYHPLAAPWVQMA